MDLREIVRKRAKRLRVLRAEVARIEGRRDRALYRFLAAVNRLARTEKETARPDLLRLVRDVFPDLELRTASRYAGVCFAALIEKPRGVTLREWVSSKGGISRVRTKQRSR